MTQKTKREPFATPILLVVYNRPELTRRSFAAIREVRPTKLYIAADAPRGEVPGDANRTLAVRAIIEKVDWPCQVETFFQEKNLGCGLGPKTAMDWFFSIEEAGIILEDDCVAHPTFFQFCEEMLDRYRDDPRIMQVSGTNHLDNWQGEGGSSYYFSQLSTCWGWATWRRAWEKNDFWMKSYPKAMDEKKFENFFYSEKDAQYRLGIWQETFEEVSSGGDITWWDYQWEYSIYYEKGLVVVPGVNLITNIGWGEDAHHTFNRRHMDSNRPTQALAFPLQHPSQVRIDTNADQRQLETFFYKTPWKRMREFLARFIPNFILKRIKEPLKGTGVLSDHTGWTS